MILFQHLGQITDSDRYTLASGSGKQNGTFNDENQLTLAAAITCKKNSTAV